MGRHRAADRRAARPRAGTGSHGDAARIPRGPPAVRTGRTRRSRATTLVRWPGVGAAGLAAESAPCCIAPDGDRARVAALPRRTALRPRSVDRGAVDAAARGRARIRAAAARRRAPRRILHQAFERAIRHRLYDALVHHTPQRQRGGRRFRRFSASTSGRNRFAATWRRSSLPARRSAPPASSTWRCITRG